MVDLVNYKGIYFADDNKKFIDKETGAHFEFDNISKRLDIAILQRQKFEELLRE